MSSLATTRDHERVHRPLHVLMRRPDARIHVFPRGTTSMAGTSPAITSQTTDDVTRGHEPGRSLLRGVRREVLLVRRLRPYDDDLAGREVYRAASGVAVADVLPGELQPVLFVAGVLAAIGIYGVVRYLVEQRTREIGVRMALGATPQSILKMVLAKVGQWTIVGSALGLFGAWACARLLLYRRPERSRGTFSAAAVS